jgi:hypothetical protein
MASVANGLLELSLEAKLIFLDLRGAISYGVYACHI